GAVFVPGSCAYRRPAGSSLSCNFPPDLWQEDFAASDRITTTFAVQVTEGSMGWPLVNCAYLNWDGNQKEMCFTTTVNPSLLIYLPLVMRNFPPMPDLRVVSLTVEPSNPAAGQSVTITIVVQNVGGQDAGPFWVDLYDNPDPPPTQANQPFDQLCSGAPEDCYGISWYIDTGLNAGQSVVLTSLTGTMLDYSRWPGYFVDSGPHDV
ncbi:MAG: CARDB domain-containing protein, partial [Anaerolineae bacterium]